MTEKPENCGSCRHYQLNSQFCRRYPPEPVDNRHVRFPRTQWDDFCGEHQFRDNSD